MVVFDTSVLALAFDKDAQAPINPDTKRPISNYQARVNSLIKELSDSGTEICIPTPVLAEFLVKGGSEKATRLAVFKSSRFFAITPFDEMAAIECAMIEVEDAKGSKPLSEIETKAKVKFDRQIIAIAKVRDATAIYTGDQQLGKKAKSIGLGVVFSWELPSGLEGTLFEGLNDENAESEKPAISAPSDGSSARSDAIEPANPAAQTRADKKEHPQG
jgi:rRNA-processing protein FCF1